MAELIFGHLLTGSNYNDDVKKVVGGRNGYGAKLTNIFSKKFIVECGDCVNRKRFKMTWQHNMGHKSQPIIDEYGGSNFTKVSFWPDLPRFGMEEFGEDFVALIKKRVYDMAGIFGGKMAVYLNGHKLKLKNFKEYAELYRNKLALFYDEKMKTDRWDVLVTFNETSEFQNVSFVNGICTHKGGTHVTYITDQVC